MQVGAEDPAAVDAHGVAKIADSMPRNRLRPDGQWSDSPALKIAGIRTHPHILPGLRAWDHHLKTPETVVKERLITMMHQTCSMEQKDDGC